MTIEDGNSAHFWFYELFHPLNHYGYQFWSGIGSDFGELTLITAVLTSTVVGYRTYKKRTECHVTECQNHGHRVHGTPYYACHEHHPMAVHAEGEPISAKHIAKAHAIANPQTKLARPTAVVTKPRKPKGQDE